jgi:hypothetical protein
MGWVWFQNQCLVLSCHMLLFKERQLIGFSLASQNMLSSVSFYPSYHSSRFLWMSLSLIHKLFKMAMIQDLVPSILLLSIPTNSGRRTCDLMVLNINYRAFTE